jgi:hypothetical protein
MRAAMANSTVSIFIRFKRGGKRQTAAAAYAGKARLKPVSNGIGRGANFRVPQELTGCAVMTVPSKFGRGSALIQQMQ